MIELLAPLIPVIMESAEVVLIPTISGWVASEIIGRSKSKHSGVIDLALGLIKAIAKEATEPAPDPTPIRKTPAKTAARRTKAAIKKQNV